MQQDKTDRGFDIINFSDCYGVGCSLQKSSSAERDCIWLGITDPKPRIMAAHAAAAGVQTAEQTGWVDYPLPENVFISARMHLTQEQVVELLPYLVEFVESGSIIPQHMQGIITGGQQSSHDENAILDELQSDAESLHNEILDAVDECDLPDDYSQATLMAATVNFCAETGLTRDDFMRQIMHVWDRVTGTLPANDDTTQPPKKKD